MMHCKMVWQSTHHSTGLKLHTIPPSSAFWNIPPHSNSLHNLELHPSRVLSESWLSSPHSDRTIAQTRVKGYHWLSHGNTRAEKPATGPICHLTGCPSHAVYQSTLDRAQSSLHLIPFSLESSSHSRRRRLHLASHSPRVAWTRSPSLSLSST